MRIATRFASFDRSIDCRLVVVVVVTATSWHSGSDEVTSRLLKNTMRTKHAEGGAGAVAVPTPTPSKSRKARQRRCVVFVFRLDKTRLHGFHC
jgi:hypothetical protein